MYPSENRDDAGWRKYMKIDQSWHVTTTIESFSQHTTQVFLNHTLGGKDD